MKLLVNREKFIKALSELSSIIKDNSIRPVISGAKLDAFDNKVKFTGTTLEFNYITHMEAEISEEGSVAFKIPLVLEYIKLLDEDTLEISVDENKLTIHRAEFSILNVEDFPVVEKIEGEELFTIPGEKLIEAFEMVKFSAFPTLDNLAINSIRVSCEEDKMQFISTDSYRLTHYIEDIGCKQTREISIPLESISIICKLLKGVSQEAVAEIRGELFTLKWENTFISTRLIEMPFPEYRAIFNNMTHSKTIELNTQDFKKAIKKVMAVARRNQETKNGSYMDFKGNKLTMTVSSGSAKTVQKVDTIKEGDDFKASLNVKFVYDFIDKIDKNVIIKATNSSSMFILEELDNNNYRYILMPLALRD